jgi:tetratricopeptide (TPR) repeat protein
MDQGLIWSQPRFADSIPSVSDEQALEAALRHLQVATYWRPDDPQAYRLAGWIYMAQKDWLRAADSFTEAWNLQPNSLLYSWERGLAFEQMMKELANMPIIPVNLGVSNEQLHCIPITVDVWVPKENTALLLDFTVNSYKSLPESSQVILRILVSSPEYGWNDSVLFFQRRATANEVESDGMVDWVDLSSFAGRKVSVTLDVKFSDSGANDLVSQGCQWKRVILTTQRAAEYVVRRPYSQMIASWLGVGYDVILAKGDIERKIGNYREALRWYERALLLQDNKKIDEFPTDIDVSSLLRLESFVNETFWKLCPWCDNTIGRWTISNGLLEVTLEETIDRRDHIGVLGIFNADSSDYEEGLIRLKGSPGTIVTIEIETENRRFRPFNYTLAPVDWEIWSFQLEGKKIYSIIIGIGELENSMRSGKQRLLVDWIALR